MPLRLRFEVVGSLNVFSSIPDALDDDDLRVAQALADVASIGILRERAISDSHAVTAQLQTALESRVPFGQAK